MALKRYEVIRDGNVMDHGPGERFEADEDDPQVQFALSINALKAVAGRRPKQNDKDADKR